MAPFKVKQLTREGLVWHLKDTWDEVRAMAVLVATGIDYEPLAAKNIARFIGHGVQYGSPSLSESFEGKTVAIVGGANSAGQAATYLAGKCHCRVMLIVRGPNLDRMSQYMKDKVLATEGIEILYNTEVVEANGHATLERIVVRDSMIVTDGQPIEVAYDVQKLYVLIGAKAQTQWLGDLVTRDRDGLIHTGDIRPMQANKDGIFAAGDVRSGSVKRVANAIGEGAKAINDVRSFLNTIK
jgi:thioredoxin reductase (NADPH)